MRVVKSIFVTRDRPLFSVKCEMANFFFVNRDSMVAVKRDFAKLFSMKREINVQFTVNRDFHYVFVIFDNLYYVLEYR